MIPSPAPESAPHTFLVAKPVLPCIGPPATILEHQAREQGRWRSPGELRRQDFIQNPFLQPWVSPSPGHAAGLFLPRRSATSYASTETAHEDRGKADTLSHRTDPHGRSHPCPTLSEASRTRR